MSVKKRGLGRGLSDLGLNELLSRISTPVSEQQTKAADLNEPGLIQVAIDRLQPGKYQPRRDIDPETLQELAESIRSQGIIQPIVIRAVSLDRYEIIAGERRWRAAQLAGLTKLPAVVKDISDDAAMAMAIIENIQREDLNAIEEALALQQLCQEFSLTHQEVATIVGKSRATISNLLRLLNLPADIKLMLEKGELEMGHARAVLSLDEDRQKMVVEHIIAKNLTVRDTEFYIKRLANLNDSPVNHPKSHDVMQLERCLSKNLGVRVTINDRGDNKGKLTVHYKNREQLELVLKQLEM